MPQERTESLCHKPHLFRVAARLAPPKVHNSALLILGARYVVVSVFAFNNAFNMERHQLTFTGLSTLSNLLLLRYYITCTMVGLTSELARPVRLWASHN